MPRLRSAQKPSMVLVYVLVVDLTDVPVMDFTAGRALDDIIGNSVKINLIGSGDF